MKCFGRTFSEYDKDACGNGAVEAARLRPQ